MTITLRAAALDQKLEEAYVLAISRRPLSDVWVRRTRQLEESPSVAFVAGVGAVLLAKATDPRIDAFVLKAREGSAGAFSLRSAATALASGRHRFGYDIGSSSDRDPINHSTLNGVTRWDIALGRIREDHKPFYQLVLRWLGDIEAMSAAEATEALAAFLRVRREYVARVRAVGVPAQLGNAPRLSALIDVLDGFVAADSEGGARGMALVAAAFRSAGLDADLPSPTDPRRIDIPIKRGARLLIGCEVKQVPTTEATADTLISDVVAVGAERGLLAVLRPGVLVRVDRAGVIRRAEENDQVVLRIADGVREVVHEAIATGTATLAEFGTTFPSALALALQEVRAGDDTVATWAAIAGRWA